MSACFEGEVIRNGDLLLSLSFKVEWSAEHTKSFRQDAGNQLLIKEAVVCGCCIFLTR